MSQHLQDGDVLGRLQSDRQPLSHQPGGWQGLHWEGDVRRNPLEEDMQHRLQLGVQELSLQLVGGRDHHQDGGMLGHRREEDVCLASHIGPLGTVPEQKECMSRHPGPIGHTIKLFFGSLNYGYCPPREPATIFLPLPLLALN